MDLVDEIRSACAAVASEARWVRIEDERITDYARSLPVRDANLAPDPELALLDAPLEQRAAFALTLAAVNFGSGYWPEVRKRPGRSGFATMALGLRERFEEAGGWPAPELAAITPPDVARTLRQAAGHELMGLYARALNDLGRRVGEAYGGSFVAVARGAGGSAVALTETLAGWDCFADASTYRGRRVPFLKRAQLACADLHHARVAAFDDLDRLTLFADNLVPHVLHVDGILTYDDRLRARIERGEPLEHGSEEEVEIRACALEAVERMARARPDMTPQQLDHVLWHRGRAARYKARPRHRARSTAY
jgi:hypothetical protein